jgi:hypothetical protein
MPTKKHGIIIETPGEARQAEPGPSVLALLTISTALSALILGGLWYACAGAVSYPGVTDKKTRFRKSVLLPKISNPEKLWLPPVSILSMAYGRGREAVPLCKSEPTGLINLVTVWVGPYG